MKIYIQNKLKSFFKEYSFLIKNELEFLNQQNCEQVFIENNLQNALQKKDGNCFIIMEEGIFNPFKFKTNRILSYNVYVVLNNSIIDINIKPYNENEFNICKKEILDFNITNNYSKIFYSPKEENKQKYKILMFDCSKNNDEAKKTLLNIREQNNNALIYIKKQFQDNSLNGEELMENEYNIPFYVNALSIIKHSNEIHTNNSLNVLNSILLDKKTFFNGNIITNSTINKKEFFYEKMIKNTKYIHPILNTECSLEELIECFLNIGYNYECSFYEKIKTSLFTKKEFII